MYVHVESNGGFIKRAPNGLTSAFSTPNLHAAIPISARSMNADDDFQDASEDVI